MANTIEDNSDSWFGIEVNGGSFSKVVSNAHNFERTIDGTSEYIGLVLSTNYDDQNPIKYIDQTGLRIIEVPYILSRQQERRSIRDKIKGIPGIPNTAVISFINGVSKLVSKVVQKDVYETYFKIPQLLHYSEKSSLSQEYKNEIFKNLEELNAIFGLLFEFGFLNQTISGKLEESKSTFVTNFWKKLTESQQGELVEFRSIYFDICDFLIEQSKNHQASD